MIFNCTKDIIIYEMGFVYILTKNLLVMALNPYTFLSVAISEVGKN